VFPLSAAQLAVPAARHREAGAAGRGDLDVEIASSLRSSR
jgi:hypothetical protein